MELKVNILQSYIFSFSNPRVFKIIKLKLFNFTAILNNNKYIFKS